MTNQNNSVTAEGNSPLGITGNYWYSHLQASTSEDLAAFIGGTEGTGDERCAAITELYSRTDNESMILCCDPSVRARRRVELQIVRRTVRALRDAGWDLVADNGEDESRGNVSTLVHALFQCDEATLIASKAGHKSQWVFFVMGNDGWDVINDHSCSDNDFEMIMEDINEYANGLEVR